MIIGCIVGLFIGGFVGFVVCAVLSIGDDDYDNHG